jgi:hypothetical protein
LYPGEGFSVKVKDIVELSKLIWLASENENLFVKSDCRMLQSTVRSLALSGNWSTPFKGVEVENKQLIQPVLAIASSENIHLVVDDTSRMELPHWRLTSYNARNIKAEFINTFLQVYEDDVR